MHAAAIDASAAQAFVDEVWGDSIVATLAEYIRIPNKSPAFDPDWAAHGYMDDAVALLENWSRAHAPSGMAIEVVQLEGRTPLIYMELGGTAPGNVLLYGHLDKQPEMTGWEADLGPWKPVLRGERLFGRGGADDGYATFASLTALNALLEQGVALPRCVILIEACEESGSFDLPHYISALEDRIGSPDLVICLDSGCGNYDQLWCTTSLRGLVTGNLRVELLSEGVHSGDASGVVASSFRVLRQLLSRLEDEASGSVKPRALHVEIPTQRVEQARRAAAVLGAEVYAKYPLLEGVGPVGDDAAELILNRSWRPALSITGADGLPALADAGNVLRPHTAVKLSLRLPPTLAGNRAVQVVSELFESDPPYGARVTLSDVGGADGWNAPPLAPWLEAAADRASEAYFGRPAMYMGEGGSIPFMGMLGERFPEAQFFITGVLGPHSNAHGPNEFLDLPTARRLTACVAQMIADFTQR
ncbi:MAG: M20/M25/M40 family metallo-hydrolase [Gammaproteobacteria bacterium]|nr:MAG: M20/M25/M40 family metallo-hydrolase [Gammaproteobacteria bacterium]